MSLAASFVDADTFLVAGDYIADFVVNRKIRGNCGVDGYKYTVVTSGSYAAPNSTVNLTADSDDLTANLTAVDWSVVKPGTAGNIPLHSHADEDAGGNALGTFTTSQVNAAGSGGLKLYDDAGTAGIIVQDGGTVSIGAKLVVRAADGVQAEINLNTIGAANPTLRFKRANGTTASPTTLAANDILGQIIPHGYDGSTYADAGIIRFCAAETWTGEARGNYITFHTTAIGVASAAERVRITDAGDVGIGIAASILGKTHIDQSSTSAAIPPLVLDQADLSEEFIKFITTTGTGNPIEAVGAKSLTTTHFIRVEIPGPAYVYIPVGTIA